MTESKSQVLVTLRTGDQLVFDVKDKEDYKHIGLSLSAGYEWLECGENALVCAKDVLCVYFFPDGYKVEKK